MHLIGLDLGTTNIKALVTDDTGRIVRLAGRPTPTRYLRGGGAEYDADRVVATVEDLLAGLTGDLAVKNDIAALSFAGMAETGVALDVRDRPLAPALPWFDRRPAAVARDLLTRRDPFEIYRLTGTQPSHVPSLCKILWEKKNLPEVFRRTRKWVFLCNYVALHLTGETATDPTQACRSMAYDIRKGGWSEEMCRLAGIDPSLLPPVVAPGRVIGGLRPRVAQRLGLPKHLKVVMGGHDHPCGALSVGLFREGPATNSSGTVDNALTLIRPEQIDRPLFDLGMACGPFPVPQTFYTMGGIQGAGRAVDWFIETWQARRPRAAYADMIAQAAQAPPGSNGAVFIPHLRGSTVPHKNPSARGAFLGLNDTHTTGDLARAVFEGLSMEYRLMIDGVETGLGRRLQPLKCFGGGSQNTFWTRIKAAVLNRPLTVCDTRENTALGAALLAGIGAGCFVDHAAAAQCVGSTGQQVEPDPQLAAFYQYRFESIYKQIFAHLRPVDEALQAEAAQ